MLDNRQFAEQEEEFDFQQSGGGWWIKWIGIIVYIAIIVAYAVQTLELVAWLFPADTWFMKIVTVFVCDGCATGYAMAEMFYRFRLKKSKHLVFGMWIVTFVLSTLATIIQMYLSSTHNVPHAIDSNIVSVAYGMIIAAFVVNIVAITIVIRMEYGASHPTHRYLDEKPRTRKSVPVQQTNVLPVTQASTAIDYTELAKAMLAVQQQQQLDSPLASPVLPATDQNGTIANGQNGHGH